MGALHSKLLLYFIVTGVLCLAVAILLAACGQRSSQLPPGLAAATTLSRDHPPNALQLALNPGKLESLDFFSLGGCALQHTVGKYQSALGRGASQSQRLLLSLEYLHLAPACIKHLQALGKTALANAVTEAQNLKREQLSAAIFNATLANTEFHQFWHHPAIHTIKPEQQQLSLSAIWAISALTRQWLTGDYRASNIEFEIYLSEIASGHLFYRGGPNATERQNALASLEQLYQVLPLAYQKWQTDRAHFF